jgi:hypothetical protein
VSLLAEIRRFVVPFDEVLMPTVDALADVGKKEAEAIVAWGGVVDDNATFRFTTSYMPRQTAYKTEYGLLVRVESEALHKLNVAFHEAGIVLAGQAHTHPTDAYHSDTDDMRPIVTLLGGLSLVVPNFAANGIDDLEQFAWYRLHGLGDWRELDSSTEILIEGAS